MKTLSEKCSASTVARKVAACVLMIFISVGAVAHDNLFDKLAKIDGVESERVSLPGDSVSSESDENGKNNKIKMGNFSFSLPTELFGEVKEIRAFCAMEAKPYKKMKKAVKRIVDKGGYETVVNMNKEEMSIVLLLQNENKSPSLLFVVDENAGDSEDDGDEFDNDDFEDDYGYMIFAVSGNFSKQKLTEIFAKANLK